jgi:hypothetical protein
VEFAKQLEKASREAFISHLHAALEGDAKKRQADRVPFAGDYLIPKLFAKRALSKQPEAKLTACDIQMIGAPLRWDGRDYSKFPPWAQVGELEKHLDGAKLTDYTVRDVQVFLDSLETTALADIVAEQIRAEQDALDAPAATLSS